MKGLILSFRSEFYKSRKTFGFWGAIILPFIICLFVFIGFYLNSDKLSALPGQFLWIRFSGIIFNVMGTLLLPMYIVFIAYSVNSIEYKADTWKTLFSLPISKWAVYSAKYLFAFFLVLLCLLLFYFFTLASGNLLGVLKPELNFYDYNIMSGLLMVYIKLLFASLGILSIQFLLSLLWSDFLKPLGIGFIGTIAGIIVVANGWAYSYLVPYAHPMLALFGIMKSKMKSINYDVDFFTKEIAVSIVVAVVVFLSGFFIVQRKSIK
jgi:hypothetical protein